MCSSIKHLHKTSTQLERFSFPRRRKSAAHPVHCHGVYVVREVRVNVSVKGLRRLEGLWSHGKGILVSLNIMTSYSKFDVAGGRKSRLESSVKEVEACGNT
jgi:hypothetical protein